MKKLLFFTLTFIVLVFPVLIGLSYWGSISYFGDSYKNLSPWGWPVTDTGYFSQEIYGQKYPISRKFLYKVENPNASHYLLLLGGSNTFGQGMQSNLPADIIANGLGDTNVYSLAYPGWAINNIFPLFESFDYQNEIKGEEGLVVYQFHDFHLERICGAARIFHWNDGSSPYFYLNDGQLVREGYFRDHFWEYEAKFPFLGLYRLMIWAGLGRNFGFLTLYNSFQVDSCLDVSSRPLQA